MIRISNMLFLNTRMLLVAIILNGIPLLAHASITSVTTFPASKNVALGRSSAIAVRWNVAEFTAAPAPSPVNVSSSQGIFITPASVVPGTIVGTNAKALSRTVTGSTTVAFTETVRVPEHVVYKAHKLGFSSLNYQRSFNDGGAPVSKAVVLNIAGTSGAGFNIDRIALRFADEKLAKIVKLRDAVYADAEISFIGTGLLQAVWEITDPSSTLGAPVYRHLRSVRQQLSSTQQVTLRSPKLPSYQTGLYQVRLRLTEPVPEFDMPMLQYFVSDETNALAVPVKLIVDSPSTDTIFSAQLAFRWQAVKDAIAYRLDVYEDLSSPVLRPELGMIMHPYEWNLNASDTPITGMLLPASKTKTVLSPAVQSYLTSRQHYLWRVIAIDKNGETIAVSTLRVIKIP